MLRDNLAVERLTLKRGLQLVPCAFAVGGKDRWRRQYASCGQLIPFHPYTPCPACGEMQIKAHAPPPKPGALVLDRDVAIVDEDSGEVAVVYVHAAPDLATALARSVRHVKWDRDVYNNLGTVARLSGMAVTHRTFGYQPPQPMRRRWACCRSQFNAEHPEAIDVLTEFCRVAEHIFRVQAKDVHDRTAQQVRELVHPPWLIGGTPWTSGIINQTAALPYHVDSANVPRSWSAMLGCRRNVGGGLLHLVDYDVYLAVAHGSITIFDGQSVVHGVTPLTMDGAAAWRYTAVVYAKTAMSKCAADPAAEAKRAALAATVAEDRRRRS